jgi:hypothetical protein
MAHAYEELKGKTVAQLRDIAKEVEHEAVKGYTQMNKDHLLVALCKAFGLDMHVHHHAVGAEKSKAKAQIRALKKRRDEILATSERAALPGVLREIHRLKRALRRATV